MASASQEALLRYCNDLLFAPPAAAAAGGAAAPAGTPLALWDGRVGARHGAAVRAALETLVEARLEALRRFARSVAVRSGSSLELGDVSLVFDRTESSDAAALEITNGDRHVRSLNGSNSMAVCDQGFSVGKTTWEFRLEKVRGVGEELPLRLPELPLACLPAGLKRRRVHVLRGRDQAHHGPQLQLW